MSHKIDEKLKELGVNIGRFSKLLVIGVVAAIAVAWILY